MLVYPKTLTVFKKESLLLSPNDSYSLRNNKPHSAKSGGKAIILKNNLYC